MEQETANPLSCECAKTFGHTRFCRVRIVVTHPCLKQIAQDVQGLGVGGVSPQEIKELLQRIGSALIEMDIRYKQSCHLRPVSAHFGERMVSWDGVAIGVATGAGAATG